MKVLIADDDPIPRRLLAAMVESEGHEAVVAGDGDQAWKLFARGDCHVVISDWMMPGLDGLELVRRIRASGAQGGYTYIIMLTARTDQTDLSLGMAAGADDFLIKPVSKQALLARLRVAQRIVALEIELVDSHQALLAVNERMQRAMRQAVRVQRSLLPTKLPAVAGFGFAWTSDACEELGGDTLNIFQLDERNIAFYVLDVSGHGVSSALLAVQASRLLTPLMSAGSILKAPLPNPPGYRLVPPDDVLVELNRAFPFQDDAPQFFTILYGQLELATHRLQLVSAGHPGPVLVRGGEAAEIAMPSNPIGLLPGDEAEFARHELQLQPGDRLYLYSDGVTETVNHRGEVFGLDRLTGTLRAAAQAQAQVALADSIGVVQRELIAWRGGPAAADDISLLAIERRNP